MEVKDVGQQDIANAARVSQSTVSRALQRGYLRNSKSRRRLEKYIVQTESILHKHRKLPGEISTAIRLVWDKSEAHAQLIAKVIRALDGFGPKRSLKENVSENQEN